MGKKLCISVGIYCRLQKLGMSTHFFKISLCYDKKWEIKLCISVNIYHRLLKLGMSTHTDSSNHSSGHDCCCWHQHC